MQTYHQFQHAGQQFRPAWVHRALKLVLAIRYKYAQSDESWPVGL